MSGGRVVVSLQRDAYAALYRWTRVEKMTVDILQMNGVTMRERLCAMSFRGHRLRRIALMTHLAASARPQPHLTHDVVVPDFATLKRVHRPRLVYKLLPLRCSDCETFALLQSLCACAYSPFTIDDRHEPQLLTQRLLPGCHGRSQLSAFFHAHMAASERDMPVASQRLPVSRVAFDGLLLKQGRCTLPSPPSPCTTTSERQQQQQQQRPQYGFASIAVLVTMHDMLSDKAVNERALMRDYFASPLYAQLSGNTELHQKMQRVQHVLHVMGVLRPLIGAGSGGGGGGGGNVEASSGNAAYRQRCLALARERNLHVYERAADGTYVYANG